MSEAGPWARIRSVATSAPVAFVAPIALFLLAFALRALSWPTVVSSRGVHGIEPDAWYHLRRIIYALRHTPDQLGFDPFLNFPHGARSIWPPLFDAAIALSLRPFVEVGDAFGPLDATRVEHLVVWIPPLLGSLAVLVVYVVVRRHFGAGTAWLAGGLLAVLSAGISYSRVGVLDHHAAVALMAAGLLGAGMELLRAFRTAATDRARSSAALPAAVLLLGSLQALMLQLWPGGLLHVVCVTAGLLCVWLGLKDRAEAARFGLVLSALLWVSFVGMWIPGLSVMPSGAGRWSPSVLSFFQPLLFAAGGVVTGGCALVWMRGRSESRAARFVQVLAASVGVAVLAWLFLPGLDDGLAEASTWLFRSELFQGSVVESRPILYPDGQFDPALAVSRLSGFVFVFPLAWCGLVIAAARRGSRGGVYVLLAVFAGGLALATLQQARFFNSLAIPFAIVFALSIRWGTRALRGVEARGGPESGHGSRRRVFVGFAVAVLVSLLLLPTLRPLRLDLANQLAWLRGEPVTLTPEDRYWRALEEVGVWLRTRTPSAGDAWDADARPEFGLLGHWQTGHLLLYRSERPTVVGNFGDDVPGDNYRLSFEYFGASEEEAVELLDRLRARYVVVRPLDFPGQRLTEDAMLTRLAAPDVGDASRHRLIYERQVLRTRNEKVRSHFRVFERVLAASVTGRSEPGATVRAELRYRSPTGRTGRFVQRARSDAAGRYALRLPYATRGGPAGLETAAAWQLSREGSGRDAVPLVVPEDAVQQGREMRGPDLL